EWGGWVDRAVEDDDVLDGSAGFGREGERTRGGRGRGLDGGFVTHSGEEVDKAFGVVAFTDDAGKEAMGLLKEH
ncbi:MAG: hypothetical protein Q9157_008666, partial [Trypethelium eluteriae]